MNGDGGRRPAGDRRIPPAPDLRTPRGAVERIPAHDARRGAHDAGSLPPLLIRPLPEPPVHARAWVRLLRVLRRTFR